MRVLTVIGTRPEAIKMAPVVLALRQTPGLEHVLAVTAQHRGMLDDALAVFDLRPDYDLDLMRERQSLDYITTAALSGVASVLDAVHPAYVLVHGDTTTTFAAALAAFYRGVPVGHVEAGLRTSMVYRPFPEEANRRLTDILAADYFCPTEGAAVNLRAAGLTEGHIHVTGNTALDAVRLLQDPGFSFADPELVAWAAHPGPRLLVTAHRRENWGAPLEGICAGLRAALADRPDARVLFCWHPNPAVREVVGRLLGGHAGVTLADPPRFDVFINLAARADLLLTDSGGIQEEVTQLRRFALVLREETERPEAVGAGFAKIVGTQAEAIRSAVAEALPRTLPPERGGDGSLPPDVASPFGDGYAAQRIAEVLAARPWSG